MTATEAAAVPVSGNTSNEEVRTYWVLKFYEFSLLIVHNGVGLLCFELNILGKFGLVQ